MKPRRPPCLGLIERALIDREWHIVTNDLIQNAPAPDVPAHLKATFEHLVRFAALDASYARWRAAELARTSPDWHGDLPDRLDMALAERGIAIPEPFVETPSRLPNLAKGPRGLPKHRYFHDTLR